MGLVLELNPFHNGHYYFLKEAKKRINPELTVAVISGNYTMRGDVSVLDKFTKTRLALAAGIDLVFELPFLSAINSADYFGYNAVKILTDLKITDLAFGVELDNPEKLFRMRELIDQGSFQTEIEMSFLRVFLIRRLLIKPYKNLLLTQKSSPISHYPIIRSQFNI